jgi:DNA polymerase III subunit epsilon
MQLPQKIAFVDVETTGARWSDRVIEIGIVRVENGKVTQTLNSLINPNCHVPPEITELTGISPAELEYAPTFGSLKKEIAEVLNDCVFVAHNVRFDYSFIKNEFKREEISFKSKHFCTVKLSRHLFPEHRHHNLDSLIERFKFKCKSRHRAFDDADVLWQFYQHVLNNFPEGEVLLALSKALKKPSVPINIAPDILENLPDSPGVYIFYGKGGCPLYVGKSVNLHDRVRSHFSSDHISSTEMKISQQIESIEVIETAGELGALIKESNLIKQIKPLYNRKLRHSRMMTVLKNFKTKDNYQTISFADASEIDINNLEEIYGTFRNLKTAKQFLIFLAKEFELCEKLLGVDNTNQACFGYRLGKCKGACVNKENPAKYNLRFIEAFLNKKLRPWPFESPVIIEEKDGLGKKSEGFLIDKWCYLGSVKANGELKDGKLESDVTFDVDTYKILLSYLASTKNQKNIKVFNTKKLRSFTSDNLDSGYLVDSSI